MSRCSPRVIAASTAAVLRPARVNDPLDLLAIALVCRLITAGGTKQGQRRVGVAEVQQEISVHNHREELL